MSVAALSALEVGCGRQISTAELVGMQNKRFSIASVLNRFHVFVSGDEFAECRYAWNMTGWITL